MRRLCREVERFIERAEAPLPDALQAHVARCARCQHTLRLEAAYRRAVQRVREEPVPASTVSWTRIQAQLAARAVAPRAPLGQRYAFAGSLAIAILVASLAWLTRAPSPTPSQDAQPEARTSAPLPTPPEAPPSIAVPEEVAPPPPVPKPVASTQPAPRPNRTAQVRKPTLPARAAAQLPSIAQPTTPNETPTQTTPLTQSETVAGWRARFLIPEQAEQVGLGSYTAPPIPNETEVALAFRDAPDAEPFAVASLPLSQYELYNNSNSQVEYLPIRYGIPSTNSANKGNTDDAIICSF